MKTWTYTFNELVVKLPSDLPEEGVARPVRYGSTLEVFLHAAAIYRHNFLTIAAIVLIPTLAGEALVHAGVRFGGIGLDAAAIRAVDLVMRWIASIVAFPALINAVSDVCIGNRPGLRSSYGRVGWRTFVAFSCTFVAATLVVVVFPLVLGIVFGLVVYYGMTIYSALTESSASLALLVCFALLATFVATLALSFHLFVSALYAPIIAIAEPRVRALQAIKRSRWLGHGYLVRTTAVVAVVTAILFVAALVDQMGRDTPAELGGILFARLLGVVPYITATLIYYDLRARKEGYGIAERPEDLT